MPFEYSPPKKITLITSFVVEVLGIIMGVFGALGQIDPYLIGIGITPIVSIDLVCEITGLIMTAIAWFIFYLGIKLRGV